jgi:hypothetical protein
MKKLLVALSLILTLNVGAQPVQDTIVKVVVVEKVVEKPQKQKPVINWVARVAERVISALIVVVLVK